MEAMSITTQNTFCLETNQPKTHEILNWNGKAMLNR